MEGGREGGTGKEGRESQIKFLTDTSLTHFQPCSLSHSLTAVILSVFGAVYAEHCSTGLMRNVQFVAVMRVQVWETEKR